MVGWSTLFCKYRIFSLNLLWLVSFDVHHSICNAMLLFLGLVLLHNDIPRPCWIIASSSILHQFFIIIIIKTYTHGAITCSHHSHGLIHIQNLHLQQFALVFGIPHRSSSALEKSSSAFSAFFWARSSSSCTEKKARWKRWKGVTWWIYDADMMHRDRKKWSKDCQQLDKWSLKILKFLNSLWI